MIDAGKELQWAKDNIVDRGQFVDWVETGVGISIRTAQFYMAAARFAEANLDKAQSISLLTPTTLRLISAKNTPPDIRRAVLEKAESGELMSDDRVAAVVSGAGLARQLAMSREKRLKKGRGGREASQATILRRELELKRQEDERAERKRRAAATARVLIQEIGAGPIGRLLEFFDGEDGWLVRDALLDLIAPKQAVAS